MQERHPMPNEDSLADFAALLQTLGAAVQEAAQTAMENRWEAAYLDVRSSQERASWTLKLRVMRTLGEKTSVPTTVDIEQTIYRIWQAKDTAFNPPWYGLTLEVEKSGECTAAYNYDPKCEEDKTFWDD